MMEPLPQTIELAGLVFERVKSAPDAYVWKAFRGGATHALRYWPEGTGDCFRYQLSVISGNFVDCFAHGATAEEALANLTAKRGRVLEDAIRVDEAILALAVGRGTGRRSRARRTGGGKP